MFEIIVSNCHPYIFRQIEALYNILYAQSVFYMLDTRVLWL